MWGNMNSLFILDVYGGKLDYLVATFHLCLHFASITKHSILRWIDELQNACLRSLYNAN